MNVKKILSAFAVITSAITCALAVNAQAETIDLEYVGPGTAPNSAVVAFGTTGFTSVASYEVYFQPVGNTLVDYNVTYAIVGMEHSYVAYKDTSIQDGVLGLNGTTAGTNATITSPGKILELELIFENAITEDFVINLIDGNAATFIEGEGETGWVDITEVPVSVTIPAAAVDPGTPEEPEPEIPVDPSETRAELVGYYDEWTDPVVAAFKTALTAEQCTRNVTWKVTDGSKTKEAKANFDRLTDIDIVIGLIVKNAPKNLVATIVVE